jgi:sensor domain CHASE-containing protein
MTTVQKAYKAAKDAQDAYYVAEADHFLAKEGGYDVTGTKAIMDLAYAKYRQQLNAYETARRRMLRAERP